MQPSDNKRLSQTSLPAPLALPLKVMPAFVHNTMLLAALNRVFSNELIDGELDFLHGNIVLIKIQDVGIEYRFTLKNNRLITAGKNHEADLVLQGTVYSYLLLASRKEDTDALFFSRRLHMQGDTELGLHIKNFLDGMDMDTHKTPARLEKILKKSLPVYERLFSR